jgi:potassium-dependent mechanosensitive channel
MFHSVKRLTLAFLLALSLVTVAGVGPPERGSAFAQEAVAAPDYDGWDIIAGRAERSLLAQRAADHAFEALRDTMLAWRDRFLNAQDSNQARIDTLQSQFDTFGVVPENGGKEAVEITERRDELAAQLAEALAPQTRAQEAWSRADGLVREINALLRLRQTDALLRLGPTPLNPAYWSGAVEAISGSLFEVASEISEAYRSQTRLAETRENLPQSISYLLLAAVLLWRGRRWMEDITQRLQGRLGRGGNELAGFVASLGMFLLPVIGLFALTRALNATALLGFHGQIIASNLPQTGISFFMALWVATHLFAKHPHANPVLNLSQEARREGRIYAGSLGLLSGLTMLLRDMAAFDAYSDASVAVLMLPLFVLSGLILLRLGHLMRRGSEPREADVAAEDAPPLFRNRITGGLGRVAMLTGVVGPLLALIGYLAAAGALVMPMAISLALAGSLLILSRLATDVYAIVTGKSDEALGNSLTPVLLAFALILVSLPGFSLIWGAKPADLYQIWSTLQSGFSIGETKVSLSALLTFAVVFGVGYLLTRLVQQTLKTTVLPKTSLDKGGQNAISAGLGYVGIFLAAVIGVTSAGIDLSSLALVAGALSVGIGFGLQTIVSNFVSGIILLVERPISEGDWIEVNGQMGYVRKISVRSTRIETFDRTDVILPNQDLIAGQVTNYTRGNLIGRAVIPVGVAYGTDTRRVERILNEIAQAQPLVAMNPPPSVHFVGFGADSLDFEIRAILRDVNFVLTVKSEINHEIARRFIEEDIEIPFAQRDIWLRNPEALTGGTAVTVKTMPAASGAADRLSPDNDGLVDLSGAEGEDGDAGDSL